MYGYVKVAAATPPIKVADCVYNAQQITAAMHNAEKAGVALLCLPELSITGYTCGDLFFQPVLQHGALDALQTILHASANSDMLVAVGLPVQHCGKLYNCAAVLQSGKLLGVVPKTHLPDYNEFYEQRHFAAAPDENSEIVLCGQRVCFGTQQLFCSGNTASFILAVEICEDLWAPLPPSIHHAMAGATVVVNLSASDEVIGKAEYRRSLISGQSARLLCSYLYADAGSGESTTDMVFAGHNIIAENGIVLAESSLFKNGMICAEIDTEYLLQERVKNTSFPVANSTGYALTSFTQREKDSAFTRAISAAPFVPAEDAKRRERCEAILSMQAAGLEKRLAHTGCKTALIGISGGLDSSLALLVMARAFDTLQRPRKDILAITMPCFGTTRRTKSNAEQLCAELGVTLQCVDITATVRSNFADVQQSETDHSVTYENVQARVRTLVLMNLANKNGGLVVGTGDLSELALGWATYNGDHMSMYGVNASVPKTLVRHIVRYAADTAPNSTLQKVLLDILDTPVSPELLPAENGEISQQTEDIVGPYELHDFFLYHIVRHAFSPDKIYFLAQQAFAKKYDAQTILHWLGTFYRRFFSQQFKRSCLPDGPKVGSVTLSPRADWRMPSDAMATLWLEKVRALKKNVKI